MDIACIVSKGDALFGIAHAHNYTLKLMLFQQKNSKLHKCFPAHPAILCGTVDICAYTDRHINVI